MKPIPRKIVIKTYLYPFTLNVTMPMLRKKATERYIMLKKGDIIRLTRDVINDELLKVKFVFAGIKPGFEETYDPVVRILPKTEEDEAICSKILSNTAPPYTALLSQVALVQESTLSIDGTKNNDGQTNCLACGQPTVNRANGAYQLCNNNECSWYEN